MKWYIATLKREFAKYGFVGCPLSDEQLTTLYQRSIKLEEAYMVGCDVLCGCPFDEALEANA